MFHLNFLCVKSFIRVKTSFSNHKYKHQSNRKEQIMKKNQKTQMTSKCVYNLVIVDESGSMSVIEREALAGINETITTCQAMQKKYPEMLQRLTLVTFDSNHYKVQYDDVSATEAHKLSVNDYRPCGGTPLYDAIGRSVSKLNAQVSTGNSVLVTIITDGEENCSREYTLRMINTLIEKLKKQGWTFTLIGPGNLNGVSCMGQTRAHILHFIWHEASTWMRVKPSGSGCLRGATQLDSVPIGQNAHHVRGA
mgnify:CR=1 FL=1